MRTLRMKPHDTDGVLITFCGLDGCGKSTMIAKLSEHLSKKGERVTLTKQPSESVRRSDIFRTYMDSADHSAYNYRALSLLAASDRVQHSSCIILPALMRGESVISDRYIYSCLANLRARGYKNDRWLYEISKSIPRPDLAVFLDLPVSEALSRVRSRPEEKDRYVDLELQYRLREEYLRICAAEGGLLVRSDSDIESALEQIIKKTDKIYGGKK
ncbi:MAG: dTMP kinase [Ruminococcaceae bacterium]|nr:dTMP kinase [Oscillospiraceae bacterium]